MEIDKRKIKALMARQCLTEKALAEKCGISRQIISTIIVRGTCVPKNAGKLARGLGVDVREIIKAEEGTEVREMPEKSYSENDLEAIAAEIMMMLRPKHLRVCEIKAVLKCACEMTEHIVFREGHE